MMISKMSDEHIFICFLMSEQNMWVDFTKKSSNWEWTQNNLQMKSVPWTAGRPDPSHDCATIDGQQNFTLNSNNCSFKFPAVCFIRCKK